MVKDESKRSLIDQLSPVNIFSYNSKNTERLYRLDYDRELHKKLVEAMKQAKKVRGFMTYNRVAKKGKKGKKPGGTHKDDSPFKVINPVTKLNKDAD